MLKSPNEQKRKRLTAIVDNQRGFQRFVTKTLCSGLMLVVLLTAVAIPATAQAGGQDDCPSVDGDSTEDRTGCPDSDGDGWSDPDADWTVADGADAFVDEVSQWADADRDGYGDNAAIGASNIDYWPADRQRHRPVLLIACDPASHTILIAEKVAFFCKATNPMQDIAVDVTITWTVSEGIVADWTERSVQLQAADTSGSMTIFSVQATGTQLGLASGEIHLTVNGEVMPSAIAKLPVLVVEQIEEEQGISLTKDVTQAFSFSRMHSGVVQVSGSIENATGLIFPVWLVYTALIVMFSVALKKPAIAFRRRLTTLAPIPSEQPMLQAGLSPLCEEQEPPVVHINRKYERAPSRVQTNTETIDDIDYVPKRLRR